MFLVFVCGMCSVVEAQTYSPSSFGVNEDQGDWSFSLQLPWTIIEKNLTPEIGLDLKYFETDPRNPESKCIFLAILDGTNSVILPKKGWLVATPVVSMVNPVNYLAIRIEGGLWGIDRENYGEILEDRENTTCHELIIDLSESQYLVDIGVLALNMSVLENSIFGISFDDHKDQISLKRFRFEVWDVVDDESGIDLLAYMAGGKSPVYGTSVNFALIEDYTERIKKIDKIKERFGLE